MFSIILIEAMLAYLFMWTDELRHANCSSWQAIRLLCARKPWHFVPLYKDRDREISSPPLRLLCICQYQVLTSLNYIVCLFVLLLFAINRAARQICNVIYCHSTLRWHLLNETLAEVDVTFIQVNMLRLHKSTFFD